MGGENVVLDPRGSHRSFHWGPAPRRSLDRGAAIAFISNGKPNATPLLKRISLSLQERHGLVEAHFLDKANADGAGMAAPTMWLAKVSASASAAICGCGD